uniref:Uncharacterized protein n=1 Tax=Amphimedon queenslandica TaxID=400682 RepID=A0A1X7UMX0_AMPQE
MATAIVVAVGLLLSLLYLNGVATAEDCSCQEKVNKALIQSLKGCTDAFTAMEECNKEPGTVFNQAKKVKMEAQAVGAASSCECAKKYDRVCAEISAFQLGTPDGISGPNRPGSIDDAYVDGFSITHRKSPRKHIWTFMGSSSEKEPICPCATGSTVKVPDFIGNNYFCESGNPEKTAKHTVVYIKDVLWDMQKCEGAEAPCCKTKFDRAYAVLPSPTTDDIKVMLCSDEAYSKEDFVLLSIGIAVY